MELATKFATLLCLGCSAIDLYRDYVGIKILSYGEFFFVSSIFAYSLFLVLIYFLVKVVKKAQK